MSNLDSALQFLEWHPQARLFPAEWEKTHAPKIMWGKNSSGDPQQLRKWFEMWPECYFCINARGSGLTVIDTDNKNGKLGDATLMGLCLDHEQNIPPTLMSATPSGGHHQIFSGDCAYVNKDRLGPGLDVVVMVPVPGSICQGKGEYKVLHAVPIVPIPAWFVELAGAMRKRAINRDDSMVELDLESNVKAAITYLVDKAPESVEGSGGDATAYQVACKVRDWGLSLEMAADIMHEYYVPKCWPYDPDWLQLKVENAYKYAQDRAGNAAPPLHLLGEVPADVPASSLPPRNLTPEERAIEELNARYALVSLSGKAAIAEEHEDGRVDLMRKSDFETFLQNELVPILVENKKGEYETKYIPAAKLWLGHKDRRRVDGIVFAPGKEVPGSINLWRGFAVEPDFEDSAAKCQLYREHVEQNICGGDPILINYFWAWAADLVQNPGRKPGVCVALLGQKGAGKGFAVESLLRIFGDHALHLTDRRAITGQFNGEMADKVLCFLDEVWWSGDKAVVSLMKGLITENKIKVEKKGIDAYHVSSVHRYIMASNDFNGAPAGENERRFCILNVKNTRCGDRAYFRAIAEERRAGGVQALLGWLLRYDYSGVDIGVAPKTQGLADQALANLDDVGKWVEESLHRGHLDLLDDNSAWPEGIRLDEVWSAFQMFCRNKGLKSFTSRQEFLSRAFGPEGYLPKRKRKTFYTGPGMGLNKYPIPSLEEARALFEKRIGGVCEWEDRGEFDEMDL